VDSKNDKLKDAYLKVQMLQERKLAIQMELESIDNEIKDILSKECLMTYDSIKNMYLLNVNFRA